MNSPESIENRKTASNMHVVLSSQLMAASLAVIAVEAAIATFILQNRTELGLVFYGLLTLAFLFLVASIFSGGKGIDKLARKGQGGDWELKNAGKFFNIQAITALLGLVFLFGIALFPGESKREENFEAIISLTARLQQQSDSLTALSQRVSTWTHKTEELDTTAAGKSHSGNCRDVRAQGLQGRSGKEHYKYKTGRNGN